MGVDYGLPSIFALLKQRQSSSGKTSLRKRRGVTHIPLKKVFIRAVKSTVTLYVQDEVEGLKCKSMQQPMSAWGKTSERCRSALAVGAAWQERPGASRRGP